MLNIPTTALEQLSALLLERAGLKIAADGYHGLKLALSARMPALGISDAEEYVRRLKQLAGEHELRSLLPLVTVGYTEFFRDPRQFNALEQKILPELLERARREGRKVAIWSAGCATGEEPYSVAMVLAELGAKPSEVDLLASDLNPAAIENAKLGRYPPRRLAGMSEARKRRFFRTVEDGFEVSPELRELVRFEGQNLAAPVYSKVEPGSLDLILCRNVIIYFDLPTIRGVMERFLTALRPGALLLLGYSESLFKVYDRFEMVEIEGAFVYRRPLTTPLSRLDRPAPPAFRPTSVPVTQPVPVAAAPVRKTAEVPALTPRPKPPEPAAPVRSTPVPSTTGVPATTLGAQLSSPVPAPARARRTPPERLAAIVELMERGDFANALASLQKLTDDEPNDLDAELTLGNIYSLIGQNDRARKVFAHTLAREPLCVEARVFGGVAAIQAGQLAEAKSELSKALFLEPTLAIGHYLLAQVQERSGDHEGARRSYRNALAQLRVAQRPLAGHYPDMPESTEAIARAARYALAALEELPSRPH